MKLNGKTAVITGGGSGIGAAIAKALAGEGCRVVIAGRQIEKLREAAKQFKGKPAIEIHEVDVADRASVDRLFAWVAEEDWAGTYSRECRRHQHQKPHDGRDGARAMGPSNGSERHRRLQLHARRAAANARAARRIDYEHFVDQRETRRGNWAASRIPPQSSP